MDYGLVNAFLHCEELDSTEILLRDNVVRLNGIMQKLSEERDSAAESYQRKEVELIRVSGALENSLAMVQHLAVKRGLTPLEQPELSTGSEQQEPALES